MRAPSKSKTTKLTTPTPTTEGGSEMKIQNDMIRGALREAMLGSLRVKDEMRPVLRDAVNVAEEKGAITRSDASEMRQEIRDGNKHSLKALAQELRLKFTDEQPGEQPEEQPEREEQPQPSTEGAPDTGLEKKFDEYKSSTDDKLDKLFKAIVNRDEPGTPSPTKDENGLIEHWAMPQIHSMLKTNKQVLLVGGAGTGKTTIGKQLNAKLGFDEDRFYAISLSAGVSEAHLTGRMVINGDFLTTKFLDIVENGGTILLDEFDNGDPDVLVGLNQLLANDEISVPLRKGNEMAKRHPQCYVVTSANTWGGAQDAMAVGNYVRKELDDATLDRFTCSKFALEVDRRIVNAIAGLEDDFVDYPTMPWLTSEEMLDVKPFVIELRRIFDAIVEHSFRPEKQIRKLCSPRFIEQGAKLVREGWRPEEVLKIYLQDWSDDELHSIGVSRDKSKRRFGLVTINVDQDEFFSVEGA